jgi:hypothetical protein
LRERDQRVSRFPEDFGWIHEFDALRSVPKRGGPLAGAASLVECDKAAVQLS